MNQTVLENFNPPPVESFDGKYDPQEHLTTFNTQISFIEVVNH